MNGYLSRVARPLMSGAGLSSPRVTAQMIRTMRPGVNRTLVALSPVPAGTRSATVRTRYDGGAIRGEVRGEWVRGPRIADTPIHRDQQVLYYLHGSGFVVCSARTHRGLVARLSHRVGMPAFVLDYRLGPEYGWPSGGDDAIRGYHWLLSQGFAPEQIVIGGDSAGGHLALDLLAANHAAGVPQPAAMVLFSPLYDPTFQLAVDHQLNGHRDPIIDAVAAQKILRLYTRDADPDHHRMRIPLNTAMTLPDTLIQYGGLEVMGADARAMHAALTEAGALSLLQAWPDQSHVFQMFPRLTPESRHAVSAAAQFISSTMTADERRSRAPIPLPKGS
ncbi:alpha/beta hydrolase [Gordonia sp. ABSL1-1]|uniref:alpha/beta hydrolase n=1 Tax=Gordonia sp. ABSL1-1 TaxID=3053923 RepID=UPI00257292B4|nr:alpha/beta hydrolase [Gordonia sp. ABSL1-1]MDL9935393.1 alpha/beta hydrolase [Gordonia sp. ABSL1-1]